MPETSRILVVIDPAARAQHALERAAWVARALHAEVLLFACGYDDELVEPAAETTRARALEEHLLRLRAVAEPLRGAGVPVSVDAQWGHPSHESIVRKAAETRADLVMKDTPYDSDARRSLLSNTDWSLIRSCPAPLWLVKPQPPAARPRIVAAVDPLHDRDRSASLDHRILATAKRLGEAVGGVTHAFHAFDVEPLIAASTDALSMPIALPLGELSGAMHERHAAAVEELTMAHAIPRDRVELLHGRPSDQLIALTNRLEADLVVMGAVSRSGYERLFVGSTAEDVVDKLPCDVLLLKRAEAPPR